MVEHIQIQVELTNTLAVESLKGTYWAILIREVKKRLCCGFGFIQPTKCQPSTKAPSIVRYEVCRKWSPKPITLSSPRFLMRFVPTCQSQRECNYHLISASGHQRNKYLPFPQIPASPCCNHITEGCYLLYGVSFASWTERRQS